MNTLGFSILKTERILICLIIKSCPKLFLKETQQLQTRQVHKRIDHSYQDHGDHTFKIRTVAQKHLCNKPRIQVIKINNKRQGAAMAEYRVFE